MSLFRDIERRIDHRLRKLFGANPQPGQGRELVEIQRFILDRIDDRIQQLPRARRSFPYNLVAVRIPAAEAEQKTALEAFFVADNALRAEILEHLRDDNVEFPRDLDVETTVVDTTEFTDPSLVFQLREPAAPARAERPHAVRFTPVSGGETIEVAKARLQVGRTGEVLDDRRRLVRRNDVIFEHDTVSRAHAHLEITGGEIRLYDDGSSYGTSVIHDGKLVEVPRSGGRGMRVEAGDEIYFGQVRVRFDIVREP